MMRWGRVIAAGALCGGLSCVVLSGTQVAGGLASATRSPARAPAAAWMPVKLPAPPAGFSPLRATQAQLARYGFPLRPAGGGALKAWTYTMSHALHYEAPTTIRLGSVAHVLPPVARGGDHTSYSGNWGGYTMSNSLIGGAHYTWVSGQWYQPSVPANSSYPKSGWDQENDNAPDASFWTGIGISSLIQAGADSISTDPQIYTFWYEDFNYGNTVWVGSPSITAGDTGNEFITYNSNNTSSYFLENVTTGGYTPYQNKYSPDIGFRQLDYINEVLGAYLPDFHSATFSYGDGGDGTSTVYLQSNNSSSVTMSDNGGSSGDMSVPGGIDNNIESFTETWKKSS